MRKPFIYLAALRRTGSTVLSEALTLPPHSYVFREPRLPLGHFRPKSNDVAFFRKHGVDLSALQEKLAEEPKTRRARCFKEMIVTELTKIIGQVGIKEIHHAGWEQIYDAFPKMRVILTGRDPRDIYISLHKIRATPGRRIGWEGPFTPERVAERLCEDFHHQLEMAERAHCLHIRYEDFCADPGVYARIKRFVESDIPEMGMIGGLSQKGHNRRIHGEEITDRRVGRWQKETDEAVVRLAQQTYDLMPDYCEFGGY